MGLLLIMACACGGDDDKKLRSREDFCRDWAAATCTKETLSACQASDDAACHKAQAAACTDRIPENFSDEMGQACIDAVKAAYADADLDADELAIVVGLGAPCDKLIRGDKEEGEDCDTDQDCDTPGGYECVRHADADSGTCQIPESVGSGRDCSSAKKTCEVGFYCNGDNCVEGKDAGDDCTIQEECGEAAFCNDDGKCETKHKTDTSCSSDEQCAEGVCYEYEGDKTCTSRIRLGRGEPLCEELK